MPSLFDEAFAIANDLFAEAFGIEGGVTLCRAGWETAAVPAEVVLTNHESLDEASGFVSTVQSRDYLIATDAYQINGEVVEPRAGDVLRETIGGVECQFQVMPIANGRASEWFAAGGERWIIRTKRVAR
jgi:hypothetical protein